MGFPTTSIPPGGVQALEESLALSADDDRKSMEEFQSQLDAYMQELQSLNTEYTICSRWIWWLQGNMPSGTIKRAFKAYRKDPNWHLWEWLRQDCVGRGGCCGRDYGCCERVRKASKGPLLGWGQEHYTSPCGCCIHTLGYPEGEVNKQGDIKNFPFDISSYSTEFSSRRILWAYIFGVSFLHDLVLLWIMKNEEIKQGGRRLHMLHSR